MTEACTEDLEPSFPHIYFESATFKIPVVHEVKAKQKQLENSHHSLNLYSPNLSCLHSHQNLFTVCNFSRHLLRRMPT